MSSATLIQQKARPARRRRPAVRGHSAPLLDNGYRLSQAEFHRRYERMPEVGKAELVGGLVLMESPVGYRHGRATHGLSAWLGSYEAATPGVEAVENATLVLDDANEFQPDLMLRLDPGHGGRSRVVGQYLHGVPELVVEVAVSSVARDLHAKFDVYRRLGVPEYLVWQLEEPRLDWFHWQTGEYRRLTPGANGLLASPGFPGLWLDAAALLAGDSKRVRTQLQKGLRSAGHRRFVQQLAVR